MIELFPFPLPLAFFGDGEGSESWQRSVCGVVFPPMIMKQPGREPRSEVVW